MTKNPKWNLDDAIKLTSGMTQERKISLNIKKLNELLLDGKRNEFIEFIQSEIRHNVAEALEKVNLQDSTDEEDVGWNGAVAELHQKIAAVKKEYGIEI